MIFVFYHEIPFEALRFRVRHNDGGRRVAAALSAAQGVTKLSGANPGQGAARTTISPGCVSTAPAAQVAQLVEHVTENHGVGGSIPPLGTIIP
jgi:hypothetical protein